MMEAKETVAYRDYDKVLEDLNNIILDKFVYVDSKLEEDTPLFNGGISLNSTQMIELTIAVEKFYGVEFSPKQMNPNNFITLGHLATMIKKDF